MTVISDKTFDEERALYNLCNARVTGCTFAGPADGESAFKEARNIEVDNCTFSLRYPFWHCIGFSLSNSKMNEPTRAPMWYSTDGQVRDVEIYGVKCLRESKNIAFKNVKSISTEFGWRCDNITFDDCDMESEYFLFESKNIKITNMKMKGKYSFQYVENLEIQDSFLDTKDAFWHTKNAVIKDTVIQGEYLGWYSENLTLINCDIRGTQPLCYCKGLKLVNCTMVDADLSFEYSDVDAEIKGDIISVKNPASGRITADSIGEIITKGSIMENNCEIITKKD